MAVRERGHGGKQIVAVSKYGNRKDNWAAAGKPLKMLLAGKSTRFEMSHGEGVGGNKCDV